LNKNADQIFKYSLPFITFWTDVPNLN